MTGAPLLDGLVDAARAAGDRVLVAQGRRVVTGAELATGLERLPRQLVARGMRAGDVVLYGIRPGAQAVLVLSALARIGASVAFVDPAADEHERPEPREPDWVVVETLLYAGSAPTPLRGYLRRRGFTLPRLAHLPGTHVRVGRRIPGLVPRSLDLRSLLRDPAADGAPLSTAPAVIPDELLERLHSALAALELDAAV